MSGWLLAGPPPKCLPALGPRKVEEEIIVTDSHEGKMMIWLMDFSFLGPGRGGMLIVRSKCPFVQLQLLATINSIPTIIVVHFELCLHIKMGLLL